ncbi:hypothetical protein WJ438_07340 [Streptomyces sp. GD-15H]
MNGNDGPKPGLPVPAEHELLVRCVAHVVTTIEESERFGRVLEQIGAH